MINRTSNTRQLPVSEYQRKFFIEWAINPSGNAYNESFINRITGNLNREAFRQACEHFVKRNEIMHARYSTDGKHCYYGDYGIADFYEEKDLQAGLPIEQQIRELVDRPFDLTTDILLRMTLIKAPQSDQAEYYFVFCAQHIIVDLTCTQQIFFEIESAYNLLVAGEEPLLEQTKTFTEAIAAESVHIDDQYKKEARAFWLDFIGDVSPRVDLPQSTKMSLPGEAGSQGDRSGSSIHFSLNDAETKQFSEFVKLKRATPFILLSAIYGLVISKYSNRSKVLVSYPLDARPRGFKHVTGCFVNNLPLKVEIDQAETLDDLISELATQRRTIRKHQGYSFTDIIMDQHDTHQVDPGSLFNVGIAHSYLHGFSLKLEGLDVDPVEIDMGDQTVSELGLLFNISADGLLIFRLEYRNQLFEQAFVQQFADSFKAVVLKAINGEQIPVRSYQVMVPDTLHQVLFQWNDTARSFLPQQTLTTLFRDQVRRSADKIALVCGEESLSYTALDEKSNALARVIQQRFEEQLNQTLTRDSLVGLYLEESLELIIGMLAILKAGAAYVPISTEFPEERVRYILSDAGARLVLTQGYLKEKLEHTMAEKNAISIDLSEPLYDTDKKSALPVINEASDLAYMIYTSGTTGQPKGVMIEHMSVANLVFTQKELLPLGEDTNMLQYASHVFDASVWEIFTALLSGSVLHILSRQTKRDGHLLIDYVKQANITIALLPPTLLESLPFTALPDLKVLVVGGDLCSTEVLDQWSRDRQLINAYGPSEGTVIATINQYRSGASNTDIGRPIDNVVTYVLDNHLNPVPVGVTGELYIGGAGLARGYRNRPELTSDRFIANPFDGKGNSRLYRTGDLARWTNDGCLTFIGRNDNQVKIRGYRIEPGEIEQAMVQIPGVHNSFVLAKERVTDSGASRFLIGYYLSESKDLALTPEFLADALGKVLPAYMVPDTFVAVAEFPVTTSGKIDHRLLPDPDYSTAETRVEPATKLEIDVCQLFSEVLGIERDQISTHQNFFRIGGNSILSIQLKAKLNQLAEFKDINVADLFQYNSIQKLVSYVQDKQGDDYHLLEVSSSIGHEEIAVIGVSGAYSGADDLDEFWKLISGQKEGVSFYSKEACRLLGINEELLEDPDFVPVQGKINDIDQFDPLFWGLTPSEARQLDPQVRKFVEHCWYVLESAGYAHFTSSKDPIGVFAGKGGSDRYLNEHLLHGEKADQIDPWEAYAYNNKDALATQTAFLLNLTGPANSINTACSTSLVTVVEACKNLVLGTCKMALAGGVSLLLPDQVGYVHQEGMIFSKDGHCRAFDQEASGTTGGSGVGVVLLKRLSDAIADEDNILGIIKGYASNNDGNRKSGFTAPSVLGQSECIINAQRMAGITSDQVSYVECHGTGTHLGDPIEVRALQHAFCHNSVEHRGPRTTVLGAVKANLGHTDAAAGVAGLTKVLSMFRHNLLPGQANYEQPNSELPLTQAGFEVLKQNADWLPDRHHQRIAGVSSFGIGGTNAHVIVGDYFNESVQETRGEAIAPGHFVIPLSAQSSVSLARYKRALNGWLRTNSDPIDLYDLAYTLDKRRQHFNYRSAYSCSTVEGLIAQLDADDTYAHTQSEAAPSIVLMFPGQGAQYTDMAKDLYENAEEFRNIVDECILLANPFLKADLRSVIFSEYASHAHDIDEITWAPISLFVVEYALAKFLTYLGVHADAYIGHSFGEYTAATLSGVFSLEDAIAVLIARSSLMQTMPRGAMLAVNAEQAAIQSWVDQENCEISLINSSEDLVVSGTEEEIGKLHTILEDQAIPVVRLAAAVGGHSKLMDQAAAQFVEAFDQVPLHAPKTPFASNLTGMLAGKEVSEPTYWQDQLRHKVQFAEGIKVLSAHFNHNVCFIEVGPGKGLSSFVNKYKQSGDHALIQTVQLLPSAKERLHLKDTERRKGSDTNAIKATLWMNGLIATPQASEIFSGARLLNFLPSYQFDHKPYWLNKGERRSGRRRNTIDKIFYERSWKRNSKRFTPKPFQEAVQTSKVLVLMGGELQANSGHDKLLDILLEACVDLVYVVHKSRHNLQSDQTFDLCSALDLQTIVKQAAQDHSIDQVIYLSSGLDLQSPSKDILAVRHLFSEAGNESIRISRFLSITFDNYEVVGNESVQEKPSVLPGITRSIATEYFNAGTKCWHLDFSLMDTEYKNLMLSSVFHEFEVDLVAIRGHYVWQPTYQLMDIVDEQLQTPNIHSGDSGSVFLITGGLGGIGHAFAAHLVEREKKSNIILLGRTEEAHLRKDYQMRLAQLRTSHHEITYVAMDVGDEGSSIELIKLLHKYGPIDLVLHAAGVGAKSATTEKSESDINEIVFPKVIGIENLLRLAQHVEVGTMINCSSLTSILPALGNMEYTAANLYLDEISFRQHPGVGRMITVNLNQVSDTGMAVDFQQTMTSEGRNYDNTILSHQFPTLIERLLHAEVEQEVILSRYDFEQEIFEHYQQLQYQEKISDHEGLVQVTNDSYTEQEFRAACIIGDVLGLDQLSIDDDFFGLGGNSILAIKVSHRLSKAFGYNIGITDIFKHKSVAKLIAAGPIKDHINIPRLGKDQAPLSFAQERLWFIEKYEQGSHAYHVPLLYELKDRADQNAMVYALQEVITRHEILRSTIVTGTHDEYNAQQVQQDPLSFDYGVLHEGEDEKAVLKSDLQKPFDLAQEYPVRAKFYQFEKNHTASGKRLLLITFHHIAFDGWSVDILIRELSAYYDRYLNQDKALNLPELEIQFTDFTAWQRMIRGEVFTRQLNFWKAKLKNYQHLQFPTDYQRPSQIDYHGAIEWFRVDQKITTQLRSIAKKNQVTLYSVLLSSVNILLSKYTGQQDIVTGSVTANRHHQQTEGLIGYFANTLVNRTLLSTSQTFEALVKQIHQEQVAVQLHQDLPYEMLVNELGVERNASQNPIFQIMFQVQSFGQPSHASGRFSSDMQYYPLYDVYAVEKFDLSISIDDSGDELKGQLSYATALFKKETIAAIKDQYIYLLQQLCSYADKPYSQVSLIDSERFDQIVYERNEITTDYSTDRTLHQLFEAQVESTPDHTALIFKGESLTYRELNERANLLARHLRTVYHSNVQQAMPMGVPIALYLEKSLEMVIAIMGVHKAGGGYVPVDVNYPVSRVEFILDDTAAALILAQKKGTHVPEALATCDEKIVWVDREESFYQEKDTNNLELNVSPDSLAYVIYTSGTTGQPKGVQQLHRNVTRLFASTEHQYGFNEDDVWTLFHAYVFDFSVWEIWGSLLHGAKLVIVPDQYAKDLERFHTMCIEHQVTVLNQTPTAFYQFADIARRANSPAPALRYVIFGGEALNSHQLSSWWNFQKENQLSTRLINMYGITETTVHVTFKELHANEPVVSNIGKPLADLKAYVLDANLAPVPDGVVGELYIGGPGLSPGYLNRPELTRERFIPNPYVTDGAGTDDGRLYKTGDLVRWLASGDLEYIGRNDEQVKIRGYRIELSEIEHAMVRVTGVSQCCVLARERTVESSSVKYLVGYYLADRDIGLSDQATILNALSEVLPGYMIPSALVEVESFPVTINGKLDKAALPEPDFYTSEQFVAPENDRESLLCGIWEEVLGIERVGVTDDYFSIGGDSILSIRLVSRIKEAGIDLSVRDIFKFGTIREILENVEETRSEETPDYMPFSLVEEGVLHRVLSDFQISDDLLEDSYPASYLQTGMLMESVASKQGDTYHDVFSYQIAAPFDLSKFERIWLDLMIRHEQLRAAFVESENGYLNLIYRSVELGSKVKYLDSDDDLETVINQERFHRFNYPEPGLFRFMIRKGNDQTFVLIFSFHHAIADGWSVASLITEFTKAYLSDGITQRTLPSLSYGKFIVREQEALQNEKHKQFWLDYLADYELKYIPGAYKSLLDAHDQIEVSESLSSEHSHKLLGLASDLNCPPDILFLGAYYLTLSYFLQSNDLVIGTVVNNRLEETGGDRLFGLHLNNLPIRLKDVKGMSVGKAFLSEVFHQKLDVADHQVYPYARIKSDLNLAEDLFQYSFNYTHFHIAEDLVEAQTIQSAFAFEKTNIPLVLNVSRHTADFTIRLVALPEFLDKSTSDKLMRVFLLVLEQLIPDTQTPVNEYQLLSASDERMVTNLQNLEYQAALQDQTITQLFELQVEKTPHHIALIQGEQALTYHSLNEKSNQLARHIRSNYEAWTGRSLVPDTLIALYLDRGIESVVGILGVLKAGGAYVPIDTTYPQRRVDFILEDTEAEMVLCSEAWMEEGRIQLPTARTLCIDLNQSFYATEDKPNLTANSGPSDLAYVIYTSGTTGQPKGVVQEHGNVIRLFASTSSLFDFSDQDVWTLFHAYVFDFSVWELWGALLNGGKLVVVSREEATDMKLFADLCQSHQVSVLNQTPTAFYQFADHISTKDQPYPNLKHIIFGGEALNPGQLQTWWDYQNEHHLKTRLINMYGITETTVHVTYKELKQQEDSRSNIGQPIADLGAYILSPDLRPVPVGFIGELFISGAGLSRGYLNREELTIERFIANPFLQTTKGNLEHSRLYKTGDLVRCLPDGDLEYVGRSDNQIKIRGYRIELGEIAYTFSKIRGIAQSSVQVKERRSDHEVSKYLVGYYSLSPAFDHLTEDDILLRLSEELPDYMVPKVLVRLESLPLTINGKLDQQALPEPNIRVNHPVDKGPTSELEALLCEIWQEVLALDAVSIHDEFFRLGGDSILSIQVSARLRQAGFDCQVKDILEHKTIAEIARHLIRHEGPPQYLAEQGILTGDMGLLPIQQWFMENVEKGLFGEPNHWNQCFLVRVPALDKNQLAAKIASLVVHHDVLRMRYIRSIDEGYELDGESPRWKQTYLEEIAIPAFESMDVSGYNATEIQEILTRWQSDFDLTEGPLFKIGYLDGYEDHSARLYFALHHLIVDSVSWRILIDDIRVLYEGGELSSKTWSYREWINSVKRYPVDHPAEAMFWTQQIADLSTPVSVLERDFTHGRVQLDEEVTAALLSEAPKAYNTEINDLLLTGLAYALKEVNGQAVQYITLEGHGREPIAEYADTSRTVGWFTTLFPAKLELQNDLKSSIQGIKESLHRIPNKGIGFGAFATDDQFDFGFDCLPEITFNYLGKFDTKDGYWQVVMEDGGTPVHESNSNSTTININGMIVDGKLQFAVSTRLGESLTALLCDSLQVKLIEIIKHCEEKLDDAGGSYTPSDFDMVEISQALLDRLQS